MTLNMLVRCAVFTALELEIACGQKKFLQSLFDLAGEAAVGVMFYCNFTCFLLVHLWCPHDEMHFI